MRRKNIFLMQAWLNGADIQVRSQPDEAWLDIEYPCWYPDEEYRQTPNGSKYIWVYKKKKAWHLCDLYMTDDEAEIAFAGKLYQRIGLSEE